MSLLSFGVAALALVVASPLPGAQDTNPIPGRPWTYIIPDPDKFDWSNNNRPGYRFAGMSPNQKRFYEYIQAKRASGQSLSFADEAMVRRLTTMRAWPEGPKPNEFWKSFMRYMREQRNDDLNTAQALMLGQLVSRGIGGFDNPGTDATRRLAEYLNSGPFESRNWFERTFGRVEPWLKYEYQAQGYAPAGPAPGNVFPPGEPFNGMQITYNVAGASLGGATDKGGFTTSRSVSGTFRPGGTLSLSGKVSVGGFGASLRAYVFAGSQNKEHKAYIKNEPGSNTGSFSISIPIPADAKVAGFSVRLDGDYSMGGGHRGLVVSGSLELDPSVKAAQQAAADAEWRAKVEETLKQLGYQNTPEGREVEAMRKVLAGGDAAWKQYVNDQQKKLGYDASPEGRSYQDLKQAVEQGGEPFNAYVRQQLGDKAPAWAQTALPDLGGISVGPSASGGQVQGAADKLSGVSSLSTVYSFKDAADGTTFEAVWTKDGAEILRSKRQAGGTGWVSFGINSSGKLAPGRYTVSILANGQLVARKTVQVS